MDNNIPEKKPKRPRIGEMRTSTDNRESGSGYERVNYQERTQSENVHQGARPYQPRQYNPRPYQQNRYNNRNDDGQHSEDRPGKYPQQGGYRPRPYQPRYNNTSEGIDTTTDGNTDTNAAPMQRQQSYQPRYNNYNGGAGNNNYRQGGYGNNRQNSGYNNGPRQGGYGNNRQNSGYNNGPRQGGYGNNNRQNGYNNGPRQGGYGNNRQNNGYNNGPRNNNGYNSFNRNQRKNNSAFPGKGKSFTPRPKQIEYEMAIPDPNEQIRLNKFMANAGICSRREADEFIQQGLVKVNGEVVTELGTKITHSDVVEYDQKVVALERKCYILLNKPKDCVTTSDDPNGRLTVMDLVKGACNERIYPVGRLDRNTTGVLLLTNDGDLASKLTHPQYVKKKIYHVWTDKDISEDDMQRIADGIELEDGEIHADAISYATETDRNQAGIEIHSGRNRIVRRIFESLGYHVTKLDRVYFAGLTKKNLPRGRWRYLTQQEVNFLKMGSFE